MRRRAAELLRLPDAAVLRGVAEEGRVHGDEPRQQPRLRLRAARARRRRSPRSRSSASRRPAGPVRSPTSRSATSRSRSSASRRTSGRSADEHPGGPRLVTEGRGERRRRHRDHARGRRGHRPHARRPGHGVVPGREPRQLARVPHAVVDAGADLVIGSGPARAAGHGVVPRAADRLLARQLRRLQGLLARWAAVGERHPRVTLAATAPSTAARSSPRGWSATACPRSIRPRARTGSCATLSREDFGARAVKVSANGGLTH